MIETSNASPNLGGLQTEAEGIGDDRAYFQRVAEEFLTSLVAVHHDLKKMVGPQSSQYILQRYEEFLAEILPGIWDELLRHLPVESVAPPTEAVPAADPAPTQEPSAAIPDAAQTVAFTPPASTLPALHYRLYIRLKQLIPVDGKTVFKPTFRLSRLIEYIQEWIRSRRREQAKQWPLDLIAKDAIPSLAAAIVERNLEEFRRGREFAAQMDARQRSVAFIFDVFANTWKPLASALTAQSVYTAWCGTSDRTKEDNYGAAVTAKIPTAAKFITSFPGILGFLVSSQSTQILLCAESFYSADWKAEQSVIQMAFIASILETRTRLRPTPGNLNLLMYDGIKPLTKKLADDFDAVAATSAIEHYYRRMLSATDRILYNSNTEVFGAFNQNALSLSQPWTYFPRYTDRPERALRKIADARTGDIHMACISICLNDVREPSRDSVSPHIREIILQRIHFHYYAVDAAISRRFQESLPDEFRGYFHHHPIITDQKELVEELQQYHIGLSAGDHTVIAEGIANIRCRFYRDAARYFMESTVATSCIVFAAAGVPCVISMGFPGGATLLGAETVIQPALSAYHQMRKTLHEWNLPARIELAEQKRERFWIENHVRELTDFLRL